MTRRKIDYTTLRFLNERIRLKMTNLDHAVLDGTILDRARLKGARLIGTTLRNMNLTNVRFNICDPTTSTFIKNTIESTTLDVCDCKATTFINIDMEKVHFKNPDSGEIEILIE